MGFFGFASSAGLLLWLRPAAVCAAFRRFIASDYSFFLQCCFAAFAPIFASLRETLLSCLSNTQLPHHLDSGKLELGL